MTVHTSPPDPPARRWVPIALVIGKGVVFVVMLPLVLLMLGWGFYVVRFVGALAWRAIKSELGL